VKFIFPQNPGEGAPSISPSLSRQIVELNNYSLCLALIPLNEFIFNIIHPRENIPENL
jgi:hypothetical protein